MGIWFPARESLVSDIPAIDGKIDKPFFTVYTDHKPLTYALGKVADGWTVMKCRQLFYMAEFTTDIRHMPGVANMVADMADTLSRPPSSTAAPDNCKMILCFQISEGGGGGGVEYLKNFSIHTFLGGWGIGGRQ